MTRDHLILHNRPQACASVDGPRLESHAETELRGGVRLGNSGAHTCVEVKCLILGRLSHENKGNQS